MKKRNIVLLSIAGVLLLFIIFVILIVTGKITYASPPFLVKNFVDLNQIKDITKYRSCQGHLVVPGKSDEPKSNMKHYFGQKPEFDGTEDKIAIYAPFDGYVTSILLPSEDNEGEIFLGKLPLPPFGQWNFIVGHVNVLPTLQSGDKVMVGQLLGYASFTKHSNAFDVLYARIKLPLTIIDGYKSPYVELDSFFNHVSDGVLAEYATKGLNAEEMILSKEARSKNPCRYGTLPYFASEEKQKKEEWIALTD